MITGACDGGGATTASVSGSGSGAGSAVVAGSDWDVHSLQTFDFESGTSGWRAVGGKLKRTTKHGRGGGASLVSTHRTVTYSGPGMWLDGCNTGGRCGREYGLRVWVKAANSSACRVPYNASAPYGHKTHILLTVRMDGRGVCSVKTGSIYYSFDGVHVALAVDKWTLLEGVIQFGVNYSRDVTPPTFGKHLVYVEGPLPGCDIYVDDVTFYSTGRIQSAEENADVMMKELHHKHLHLPKRESTHRPS